MTSTTFFFLFIPLLAFILLVVNIIFAPHNPYQEKNSPFECGYHSFLGQNRTQFSVSFFIFALLFLLFDLEILLVYPYIVSAYSNGVYGLIVMLIFFLMLTLGFAFELGKNALKIDSRQMLTIAKKQLPITSVISSFCISNLILGLSNNLCTPIKTKSLMYLFLIGLFYKLYDLLKSKLESCIQYIINRFLLDKSLYSSKINAPIVLCLVFGLFTIYSGSLLILSDVNNYSCFLLFLVKRDVFFLCLNLFCYFLVYIIYIYINDINKQFKEKHPNIYAILNPICISLMYACALIAIICLICLVKNVFGFCLHMNSSKPNGQNPGDNSNKPDPNNSGGGPNGDQNDLGTADPDAEKKRKKAESGRTYRANKIAKEPDYYKNKDKQQRIKNKAQTPDFLKKKAEQAKTRYHVQKAKDPRFSEKQRDNYHNKKAIYDQYTADKERGANTDSLNVSNEFTDSDSFKYSWGKSNDEFSRGFGSYIDSGNLDSLDDNNESLDPESK